MAEQLHFDLPLHVALGPDDYFVSEANREAFAMVTGEADWPNGKLAVIGPEGSGKSHLARLWQVRTGALILKAQDLDPAADLPEAGARVVLEDGNHLAPEAEEYLFHLHNHLAATGGLLLLTGRRAPARWPLALPDLASRLQATTVIPVADPDDLLLRAVLTKHFADRQLQPSPRLIDWLLPRIERSFASAAWIVAALDEAALSGGLVINQSLARVILDKAHGNLEE